MGEIIIYQVLGVLATLLFMYTTKHFFADQKHSFKDFFIGINGQYSLSRVQAITWATLIISFQISVMGFLGIKGQVAKYAPVFSENILWLLGLTMTSYAVVKGIAVNKLEKGKKYIRHNPSLSDLITTENGLDFSRFQIIIWSIIAISTYLVACNQYLVQFQNPEILANADQFFNSETAKLPDIPDSFLVLMGLSQGAYVGKKLVPEHKLEDIKAERLEELEEKKMLLERNEKMIAGLENMITSKIYSDPVKIQKAELNNQLITLRTDIKSVENEISEINKVANYG